MQDKVFIILFICLFLAVLYLHCCVGFSLVAMHGLLIVAASLVAEHRRSGTQASVAVAQGLISCGSQAPKHRISSCGTLV